MGRGLKRLLVMPITLGGLVGGGIGAGGPAVAHAAGYVGYIGSGSNQVPASVATGSYPTVVVTHMLTSDEATQDFFLGGPFGAGGVGLIIPGGALPAGTQVTIAAGDPKIIQPTLPGTGADPAKTTVIDSFAVAWTPVNGGAAKPLFLTVFDPGINKNQDTLYTSDPNGIYGVAGSDSAVLLSFPAGSPTEFGRDFAGFKFTADPGFVVTGPVATAASATVPATSGTIPTGPGKTGALPTAGDRLPGAMSAILIGAGVLGSVVRRRRRVPRHDPQVC